MAMQTLTKTNVKQLRADLEAALASVTAKHGVAFNIGTMRFDSTAIRFKTNGAIRTAANSTAASATTNVNADEVSKQNFLRYVGIHGFKSSDLGRKFRLLQMPNTVFELVGYAPNRPKFPMQLRNQNGRMFKMTKQQVATGLQLASLITK